LELASTLIRPDNWFQKADRVVSLSPRACCSLRIFSDFERSRSQRRISPYLGHFKLGSKVGPVFKHRALSNEQRSKATGARSELFNALAAYEVSGDQKGSNCVPHSICECLSYAQLARQRDTFHANPKREPGCGDIELRQPRLAAYFRVGEDLRQSLDSEHSPSGGYVIRSRALIPGLGELTTPPPIGFKPSNNQIAGVPSLFCRRMSDFYRSS
jgi:hypothetical protein